MGACCGAPKNTAKVTENLDDKIEKVKMEQEKKENLASEAHDKKTEL